MESTIVEELPCKLTASEKLLKSDQMAKAHKEIVKLEAEKKLSGQQLKSSIDARKGELALLAREIETGEELRPVECKERPRYQDLMVDTIRLDTGEVVSSRGMEPAERQKALDYGDAPRPRNSPPMPKRGQGGKFLKRGESGEDDEGDSDGESETH